MVARPEDSVYWNMTVEYGIRYMKMLSEWCDSCIKILEDVENENTCYNGSPKGDASNSLKLTKAFLEGMGDNDVRKLRCPG